MYAVVRTGGKQYRVSPGDILEVEKLDAGPGEQVELDEVLLVADGSNLAVGHPLIEGAKVRAEVVRQGKAPKILVFKYRRRKRYRRKVGHRQPFTALKIGEILGKGGASTVAKAKPVEAKQQTAEVGDGT